MSETEWRDDDDPRVREAFGYELRPYVKYQDGAQSDAPALIFADYDYEVGDGSFGLHEDGKHANEPAIVYVRADAYLSLKAENEKLRWMAYQPASKHVEGCDCGQCVPF